MTYQTNQPTPKILFFIQFLTRQLIPRKFWRVADLNSFQIFKSVRWNVAIALE
jgi:hypothetical protein